MKLIEFLNWLSGLLSNRLLLILLAISAGISLGIINSTDLIHWIHDLIENIKITLTL